MAAGNLTLSVSACIDRIAALRAPRFDPRATPAQIEAAGDFLRAICAAVDPLVADVGRELKAVAPGGRHFDLSLFEEPLYGALDGMALWEIAARSFDISGLPPAHEALVHEVTELVEQLLAEPVPTQSASR